MGSRIEVADRLKECRIVQIPRFVDQRGSLCVIEWGSELLPFDPQRFYYMYGDTAGSRRGCHAHSREAHLMLALSGSFQVRLDDGYSQAMFHLNDPGEGLYVPALIWHEVHSFSPGSVCGVLASNLYDPEDCYSSYEDFLAAVRQQ